MAGEPISIFLSYSRKDEALMRGLESHLEALKLSGLIDSWHDGCIAPGEEWEIQIKQNLKKAKIILLLISVDFIKSNYCYSVELTQAIERHQAGDACIIPIILRPCIWKPLPICNMHLGDLQALPKDGKPISKWDDIDDAFTNIAERLAQKVLQLHQQQDKDAAKAEHEAKLRRYRQALMIEVTKQYPLSQTSIIRLRQLRKQLSLAESDIYAIQQAVLEEYEKEKQEKWHPINQLEQEKRASAKKQPSSKFADSEEPSENTSDKSIRAIEQHLNRKGDISPTQFPRWTEYKPPIDSIASPLTHPSESEIPINSSRYKLTQEAYLLPEDAGCSSEPQSQELSHYQEVPHNFENSEDLGSDIFLDNVYAKLQDLLIREKWYQAHEETNKRILELVNRQHDSIRIRDLKGLPSRDLKNIDRLWFQYSDGRFGFRVQRRVWEDFGEPIKYGEFWEQLGWKLGWRRPKKLTERGLDWIKKGVSPLEGYEWTKVNELQFDIFAPEGHLPVGPFVVGSITHYQFLSSLKL
jgi:hypothetical protein